ncbi:DUF4383 domain-containing protein [Arthrobacter sp. TMS1-12-1]
MSSSALNPKRAHAHSGVASRTLALVAGGLMLLIGVLSLIPGITSNYNTLAFASNSSALFLGIFQTSVLLSVLYALVGAAGIVLARQPVEARYYLLGAGVFFLVLWIYGLFVTADVAANFLSINAATNWANLVLGIVLVVGGALASTDVEEHAGT